MPCMTPASEMPPIYDIGAEVPYPHEVASALTGLESVQLYGLSSYTIPERSRDTVIAIDQPLADRLSRYSWIVQPKTAHSQELQPVYRSIKDSKASDNELNLWVHRGITVPENKLEKDTLSLPSTRGENVIGTVFRPPA